MGGINLKFLITVGIAAAKGASEKFLTPEAREKINTALSKAKDTGEDTLINILKEHAPEFLDKAAKAKGGEALTKDDLTEILKQFQQQQNPAPKAEEPKKPAAKKKNPPGKDKGPKK
jgi:hypothetical protein